MRDFWLNTHDLLLRGAAAVMGFFYGMTTGQRRCLVLLAGLMIADGLTGLAAGLINKKQHSTKKLKKTGFASLVQKAVLLVVLALSALLDWLVHDGNAMFFTAVCWLYISTEALSLLENLTLCRVPVPNALKKLLSTYAAKEEVSLEQPQMQP